jgi:hypothetical protein
VGSPGSSNQSSMNNERSIRPISRKASASPFVVRGSALSSLLDGDGFELSVRAPAASARAAAVISESIGIPRHTCHSRRSTPGANYLTTKGVMRDDEAHDRDSEEWLAARLGLLGAEKERTRRSDELARRRQELPWVRVDKEYRFETDEGSVSLADLFRGRSQLLVYFEERLRRPEELDPNGAEANQMNRPPRLGHYRTAAALSRFVPLR